MTTFRFKLPVSEDDVRRPRIGDEVYVTGLMVTARDQAHKRALKFLSEGRHVPFDFGGMAVFHCGPIVKKENDHWSIVTAGPTTSTRMEAYEAEFIEKLKPRIIIGKAGMGARTADAMKKFGAIYCDFTGGAAVLASRKIKRVRGVEWLDLGMPEALWILEVEDFGPTTVTIDSFGQNLHAKVREAVERRRPEILKTIGVTG
ncbi:MAG: FumA C-terminus/TtdB family hydratase beta subunit [archaeon]